MKRLKTPFVRVQSNVFIHINRVFKERLVGRFPLQEELLNVFQINRPSLLHERRDVVMRSNFYRLKQV